MSVAPVRIRRAVVDAIVEHARQAAPLECCGLLLGRAGEIVDHARAANVRRSASRYEVDPADHFAAIRRARREGCSVIGAYHSHPASAAVPSATDIREANDPQLLHLIVSLARPEAVVSAYRILHGNFEELVLVTVP